MPVWKPPPAESSERQEHATSSMQSYAQQLTRLGCTQELKRLLDDDEDINDIFLHTAQQLPAFPSVPHKLV